MARPIILLTNDDGIYAGGIHVLRKTLEAAGMEVKVVAPDRERSASGHAITMHRPLMVEEISLEDGDQTSTAWVVSGTPADCAKLAIEALLPQKPTLAISGINRGPNLGTDVFYSGTVSAAVEATILGVPAFAVSVAAWENPEYGPASLIALVLARKILEAQLPRGVLLNVNVPALPGEQVAGVAVTKLGPRKYANVFDRRVDPRGRVYYWMAGEVVETKDDNQEGTDVWAIGNNLISITPIRIDLTARDVIPLLKSWNLSLDQVFAEHPEDQNGGGIHGVRLTRRDRVR